MKGKKCFGLLLALSIIFGVSFVVSPGVSALRHEYVGLPYSSFMIPSASVDSSGRRYLDWSSDGTSLTFDGSSLELRFEGDSAFSSDDWNGLATRYSSSLLIVNADPSDGSIPYYLGIDPIFNFSTSSGYQSVRADLSSLYHRLWTTDVNRVRLRQDGKEIENLWNFNSIPAASILRCSRDNGAVCPGLWNVREYVADQINPFTFTSDGFYLKSKAISVDGETYSNTFSFSDLFTGNYSFIPRFSYLSIPLHTFDGYFLDSSNLKAGRHLEFSGSFEFDGSFNWHEGIESNGSFMFKAQGQRLYGESGWLNIESNCTTNLITLDTLTRLDYTCPVDIPVDLVFLSGPRIEISGNGNYVWETDKPWRFVNTFLTTDYDDTPGSSFNSDIVGGGDIPGNASNNIPSDDDGWFDSLTNMFTFGFFNPFAPIFQMFSDNNSCASIPTIAGMIHSEETEVCPWFASTTRNVVTPVLGLSSMMLVFGFAVRWLGSSSGNLFEDSQHEEVSNQGGRWGHFKKGGS